MKTKFRILLSAITFIAGVALLFAALALPVQLAAQGQQQGVALPAPTHYCEVGRGGRLTGTCLIVEPALCLHSPCAQDCRTGLRARNPGFMNCLGTLFEVDFSRPCCFSGY
jgi:hypothetical protein